MLEPAPSLTYFWSSQPPSIYWSFLGIIKIWIKLITGQSFCWYLFSLSGEMKHWVCAGESKIASRCVFPSSAVVICGIHIREPSTNIELRTSKFLKSLKGRIEAYVYGDGVCHKGDCEALIEITERLAVVSLSSWVSRFFYLGCLRTLSNNTDTC